MKQVITSPIWWSRLATILLTAALGTVLISIVSILAATTGAFSTYDFAGLFTYGIVFIYSWYATLALALIAASGIATGYFLKHPLKKYVIMLFISFVPTVMFNALR